MTVSILVGDVFERLADLPDDHFDTVITSPPYWGLRDYGVDGQIGMEPTLDEHLDVMVRVFDAVRRVMKPEATLWLNYGDCYATKPNGRSAAATKAAGNDDRTFRDKPFSTVGGSLKPKDLCMVPNRLAIALQDAGWWVRSEIVWGKPNPMPDSSGRYRPSTAHEKIWLLTKSAKSHYDSEAVRMPAQSGPEDQKMPDGWDTSPGGHGSFHRKGRQKGAPAPKRDTQYMKPYTGQSNRGHAEAGVQDPSEIKRRIVEGKMNGTIPDGRLLRNYEQDISPIVPPQVWNIATAAYSKAHFATFPPALVVPCLLAGCPEGGRVLDPFGGAGTTALVADRMQRDCTLIELNPEYAELARARIEQDAGLFAETKQNEVSQ